MKTFEKGQALRIGVRLLVSVAVSFGILAFLLRLVMGGVDAAERPRLLEVLGGTAFGFVVLYAALTFGQILFRAARYRVLIGADEEARMPGYYHTTLVTAVRNMLVDLLPARLGELSYIGMMNRGCRVSGRACVSSLAVGFAFDLFALFAIVLGVVGYQLISARPEAWLLYAAGFTLVVSVVGLGAVFAGPGVAVAMADRFLGRLARGRVVSRVIGFTDDVAKAVRAARQSGIMVRVFALSLAVRICKYAGLYFLFRAVAVPSFPALGQAPLPRIVVAFLCAEGMASLPVPSFMSFGTYEAGGALALTLLGAAKAESAIAMLAIHIVSQTLDYSVGGVAFILFLFRGAGREKAALAGRFKPAARTYALLAAGGAVVLVAAVVLGLQLRSIRKQGALRPPEQGEAVPISAADARARSSALRDTHGFIVWSSNRYGNHDILKMTLPDGRISRLTDNPHVETFPRISPDGKRVVFARSREPWVSQRNYLLWDVYMLELGTQRETLVAEHGNAPSWSADGKTVYFQRQANSVVAHALGSGDERVVCSSAALGMPDTAVLETPVYSEVRDRFAVTLRGSRRGTVVAPSSGVLTRVGGGCQLAWAPDGKYLYGVDKGGRLHNAFYRYDYPSLARTLWFDMPGEFSHEYFPRVSNDGRYLVFGASTGGHEHDTADYEIFLWRIGTPPETAVRMTYHTGNDCWPDVYIGSNGQ